MAASTDTARMLLSEPINGTGDITAYITQFELSTNLQYWMAPRKDADCSPELNGDINQLYIEKKTSDFSTYLKSCCNRVPSYAGR